MIVNYLTYELNKVTSFYLKKHSFFPPMQVIWKAYQSEKIIQRPKS